MYVVYVIVLCMSVGYVCYVCMYIVHVGQVTLAFMCVCYVCVMYVTYAC